MVETLALLAVAIPAEPMVIERMEPADGSGFGVDVGVVASAIGAVQILPPVAAFVDSECYVRCLPRK